ncbi:hypothetical protein B0H34DRAFT_857497 [Crassisporium funariophilum]|nr:hypothetical protein B0H34DRAFT_857497 [Crassisporium funariophilum]
MALKRKLDVDSEDVSPVHTKQLKLVPFPNLEFDTDVTMSEPEPLYPDVHHSRLPSNASSSSSNTSDSPVVGSSDYPSFDLYPLPFFGSNDSVDPNSHSYFHYSAQSPHSQVGLRQPTSTFAHHGTNCTQIPKLRIACASSVNGQRTMWSHCEQCGAISMVESD